MDAARLDGRTGLALVLAALAGCAAGLVAGVRSGPLWLDETIGVEIARLPLGQLHDGLRVDGAPPLYYLLLKAWTDAFGTGTTTVRLLTVLMVPLALWLSYALGHRLGGVALGRAAVVVLATLPWFARYGSETRMYLLVVVLVLCGGLALRAVHATGSRRAVLALGVASGLLMLTHYWALFLLAAVGLLHLRGLLRQQAPAVRVAAGLALGGVLFLPWLPTFLFQVRRTGAPWADPLAPVELLRTPRYWGGGSDLERGVLGVLLVALVVVAVQRRPYARALGAVAGLTLLLAWTAVLVGGGAYTGRYTAVVVPLVALAAGAGALALPGRWTPVAALVVLGAVGLSSGIPAAGVSRASADGVVQAFLAGGGESGDLLAYCPDQLGPPVWRLLEQGDEQGVEQGVEQVVYPTLGDPQRVDWVDYRARQDAASPTGVAAELDALAGDRRLWLLAATEYRTFEGDCEQLLAALRTLRGEPVPLFGRVGTTGQVLYRFD